MKSSQTFQSSKPKSKIPLTARQREVLEVIHFHFQKHGIIPSLREIAAELGLTSINGVRSHLAALERKGAIMRHDRSSRAIVLLMKHQNIDAVPVRASITNRRLEGQPQTETLSITNDVIYCRQDCFAIQFLDDSLASEYSIQYGDLLLLYPTRTLKNNDVALIADSSREVYLVKCQKNPETQVWEYYSCGSHHEKIGIVDPQIVGIVITLMRFRF